jgi:beta-lactamase regulating signal transducer with metallopeptidase domain
VSALVDAGMLAKGWLAILALMAAQGTLLALVALGLARAVRLHPAWAAAIWLVVVAKLALPWGPAMPWSLSDLIATLTATSLPGGAVIAPHAAPAAAAAAGSPWPALGWLALGVLWAAGATTVIARALVASSRTARAARRAEPAPIAARALLATLAGQARMRPPGLVIGDPAIGPHVVGALRPIISVPAALLAEPVLLRAALLHELAHVRRRDGLARVIQLAAAAILWWWPVARVAIRRLEAAREAACDAWALEAGDVARPAYARLLVRMAALRTAAAPALASPRALDARVAAVLGPPARARLGVVHRVAIAAFALVALGGARPAQARAHADICRYDAQLAEALFAAYPDADRDGDGTLSYDELCDLQATLRRQLGDDVPHVAPGADAQTLLDEPRCCNCFEAEVYSRLQTATCTNGSGAE